MFKHWLWLALLFASPALAQQPVIPCAQGLPAGGADGPASGCVTNTTPNGVSTAAENGHVLKATPGVLIGGQLNNWNTGAGVTVMLLDATAVPSNGTLATCTGIPSQTNPCIIKWYGLPTAPSASQPGTIGISWAGGPLLRFLNGLVAVCSSTGPTTLTLTAQCTFSIELQ